MPAATSERERTGQGGPVQTTKGVAYECLITGEGRDPATGRDAHAEPMRFEGRGAKRLWALHRSQIHGIKSERHERIRRKQKRATAARPKATAKRATARRPARAAKAPSRIARAYRVEPAVLFRVDFPAASIGAAEIGEDGSLRLYGPDGKVALRGRVGAPYVAAAAR